MFLLSTKIVLLCEASLFLSWHTHLTAVCCYPQINPENIFSQFYAWAGSSQFYQRNITPGTIIKPLSMSVITNWLAGFPKNRKEQSIRQVETLKYWSGKVIPKLKSDRLYSIPHSPSIPSSPIPTIHIVYVRPEPKHRNLINLLVAYWQTSTMSLKVRSYSLCCA